ncbi:MAG: RagB/SusD family nutrient uptake outer membrane protein [Prevotellaceae bacterium]|jgi:hypothetical protein|nr:RagB/SusD family nutrient uptake outer membrane protein [Prevotellaceae bacterium]
MKKNVQRLHNSFRAARRALGYLALLTAFWGLPAACDDWLHEPQPAQTGDNDFFLIGGGAAAIQIVNGAYVPLQWEYGTTYSPEWWIGDVVSDDALKGGQNIADMWAAYDLENFKTQPNNPILLDWYQANFLGVARCNYALEKVSDVPPDDAMDEALRSRLVGELAFLRALYYFRLVRVFGSVPLVTFSISSSANWNQPVAPVEAIYARIVADLEEANRRLWTRSRTSANPDETGRATKGAAQAFLLKVALYRHDFPTAKAWGDSLLAAAGEYALETDYAANFSILTENGVESVFEVQYAEEATSDYGGFSPHFGATRGTFSTILTRSRSGLVPAYGGGASEGWGFLKPSQDLYDEYEPGDPRRDATILNLHDTLMSNRVEEIYLGSRYLSRKLAIMDDGLNSLWDGHATRAPINVKLMRWADVLLMYAEACVETGDIPAAKEALEAVRARARHMSDDASVRLPPFPNYTNRKTGRPYADAPDDLREAIRHERRVELAMESHRWFDLVRWGVAKQTLDAYKERETPEARAEMATFVAGKHETFPLPQAEIDLNHAMEQNPAWK